MHGGLENSKLLVLGGIATPLKNMSSSVGIMTLLNGKIKFMFQTTNQIKGKIHWLNHQNVAKLEFYSRKLEVEWNSTEDHWAK